VLQHLADRRMAKESVNMATRKACIILSIGTMLTGTGQPILGSPPVANSFTLANGIRATCVYIADSKNVSIFSFFPMGPACDGPGQAQWSHLVEHLVIRTGKSLSYKQANAETLPDHLRLDFYGSVENWQQGLDHHLRWIRGEAFTQEVLQAQKNHVNAECDIVAQRLATHKFAMAAWAQCYRHGRNHAALKGDVDKVTLSEVQKYRDAHLAVLDRLLICVVGGVDVDTLKPIMTEKFAAIESEAKTPAPVELHPGHHEVTWDLNARHLVLTWPIPDFNKRHYSGLMATGHLLTVKFFSEPKLKKLAGMVFAGADLMTPEGSFFYISASVRPEASFENVCKRLQEQLAPLRSGSANPMEVTMIGQQLCYQLTKLTDPAAVMAQAPANMTEAMVEANIGLQRGMHDFRYGRHRSSLGKSLATVTAEQVRHVVRQYLRANKCSTCAIRPK